MSDIPVFVWPLFAILLAIGLKASRPGQVPIARLLLIPALFFTWSLFSFFGRFTDPLSILLWLICLVTGFTIGFFHMQRLPLRFHNRSVEMPGSWIPLLLSMSIFSAKFSAGMMTAKWPHLEMAIWGCELFATWILGIFAGRAIGCLRRYILIS